MVCSLAYEDEGTWAKADHRDTRIQTDGFIQYHIRSFYKKVFVFVGMALNTGVFDVGLLATHGASPKRTQRWRSSAAARIR